MGVCVAFGGCRFARGGWPGGLRVLHGKAGIGGRLLDVRSGRWSSGGCNGDEKGLRGKCCVTMQ